MIDLTGIHVPDNAPEAGACVRIERPEEGLVRLVLDPPHRPKIAVFDVPLLRDLDQALEGIAADKSVRGLVITGREPLSFVAGADIEAIAEINDSEVAAKFVREVQGLFQRLYKLGRRGRGRILTVAAVGGPVPGGATEICLACDRIVLADHPKSHLRLPEVMLGILPAWGGTSRLPRRIGLPLALDGILTGKTFRAKQALRAGLVDRLTKPEYLERIAADVATGRERLRYRGRRGWKSILIDRNPIAGALIAGQAQKSVLAKTHGHYPAPLAALAVAVRAPRIPLRDSLAAEIEAVKPLATNPVTKNLVTIYRMSEEAKKLAELPNGSAVAQLERGAVVGAGVMGAAIASLMAEKGLSVRLRDLDTSQLDTAQAEHEREIDKKRKRRRLERHQADAALDRFERTTSAEGFARCEIVIEAVAERLEVKRAVLGELAELMPEGAILATNTSSLSVDRIAETLPGPERVVGMHFFNPVRRMPLVEIVRGSKTSDETVAKTAKLAVRLGKTPVVTKDVAGFLVNRVLGPYLDEAMRLVAAGIDPKAIDKALVDFGMPMGPCELIDEVGLDIASHAGASLEAAYGERMRACTWLKPLVEAGRLGKKTGGGIFVWRKDKQGRAVNLGLSPKLPPRGSLELTENAIIDRLVLAMVNEAARALEEEVVRGPRELDLATIFGTGFAPFRGGVLRYADTLGAKQVVERLRALESTGPEPEARVGRFQPAGILSGLADSNGTFHAST